MTRTRGPGMAAAVVLAALAAPLPMPAAADVDGLARVIDGDTLEIDEVRVRLFGIDAPEASQRCSGAAGAEWDCGRVAAARLAALAAGSPVRCAARDRDRYGRVVATCTAGGLDLGGRLVAEGLAWAYVRYSEDYVADEADARRRGLGLWHGAAEAPWEFRAAAGAAGWAPAAGRAPPPDPAAPAAAPGAVASNGAVRDSVTSTRAPPEAVASTGGASGAVDQPAPRPMPPRRGRRRDAWSRAMSPRAAPGSTTCRARPPTPGPGSTRGVARPGSATRPRRALRVSGRDGRADPSAPPPGRPSPLVLALAAATVLGAVDSPPPRGRSSAPAGGRPPVPVVEIASFTAFANLVVAGCRLAAAGTAVDAVKALADVATGAKSLDVALGTTGLAAVATEMARTAEEHALHFTHPGPARDDAIELFWQVAPARLRRPRHLRRRPPRPGADRRAHGRRDPRRPARPRLPPAPSSPSPSSAASPKRRSQVMLARADTVAALAPALWRKRSRHAAAIKDDTAEILALVRDLHAIKADHGPRGHPDRDGPQDQPARRRPRRGAARPRRRRRPRRRGPGPRRGRLATSTPSSTPPLRRSPPSLPKAASTPPPPMPPRPGRRRSAERLETRGSQLLDAAVAPAPPRLRRRGRRRAQSSAG